MTITDHAQITHDDDAGQVRSDTDAAQTSVERSTANTIVLLAATLVVGLAAGFFWTYQVSVIRGLAIVDDDTYVETFQAINDTIRNTWFGIVFFGAIPLLTMALIFNWATTQRRRVLIGASLASYVTAFAITAVGNVSLNNELADRVTTDAASFRLARDEFEGAWNDLNLMRTVASVLAFAFCLAAIASPQRRTTTAA